MTILIVSIFAVLLLAGYVAMGFGESSSLVDEEITVPAEPSGGLIDSILAPFKWVYENIGSIFSIADGAPSGMPLVIAGIIGTILTVLVLLYAVKVIRG